MPEVPTIRVAIGGFAGYELLDSGNRRKLERWGGIRVVRGEPKAWWEPRLGHEEWNQARAIHEEECGWHLAPGCPRDWVLECEGWRMQARLSDTSKHVGIFPEQSPHWRVIGSAAPSAGAGGAEPPRLLNLFGYTGAATLAAARAGWSVTHVDASRPATAWARENQRLSGLDEAPIRWIVEDAMKYVRRELKRGSRYEGLLLDPPAFGRGPTGTVWKVEHHLTELLDLCRQVLSDRPQLVILTTYNIEASALMLRNLMNDMMHGFTGSLETGELALAHRGAPERLLPLSIYARWKAAAR